MKCGACQKKTPAFDATIVAIDYASPVDQLIQSFKFKASLPLGPLFSNLLFEAIQRQSTLHVPLPTLLMAVPLGAKRLSERGFNQALEIAKPLARMLDIPLDSQLALRTRETEMQSALPLSKRRQNMRNAFIIPEENQSRIQGQHIGIIDDVLTTGSTLHELATVLKRSGATRVTGIVFARTPP